MNQSEVIQQLQEYENGRNRHWSPEDADRLLLAAVDAGEPDIELMNTKVATSGKNIGEVTGHTFIVRGAVVTTRFSEEEIQGSIAIIDANGSLNAPQDRIE